MRGVALATVALVLAGCGGGDDGPARPLLDEIRPAIAAVEAELGGPQRFFEITATPQVVNLFVATGDGTAVTPFVYVGGELAPPGASQGAEGPTFTTDDIASLDPSTVLDRLDEDLDEPDVVQFAIGRDPAGELDYLVRVRSAQGGILDVTLAPDGQVQVVDAATS